MCLILMILFKVYKRSLFFVWEISIKVYGVDGSPKYQFFQQKNNTYLFFFYSNKFGG